MKANGRNETTGARLPGEVGIWVLVGGDLLVFSLFFLTFGYYRALAPSAFAAARAELGLALGLINTLLLLTGSLFVAMAVELARRGRMARGARLVNLAALSGLLFLANKAIEWAHLISAGHSAYAGDFAMLYFGFTGIHGLHVIIASAVLFFLARAMRAPDHPASILVIESCGLFWHVVDLLWIVLFALFYLAA